MQQIVHICVVLMNVVWITFFLTTDPDFSVFMLKRSSSSNADTEMFTEEFCLQGPNDETADPQGEVLLNKSTPLLTPPMWMFSSPSTPNGQRTTLSEVTSPPQINNSTESALVTTKTISGKRKTDINQTPQRKVIRIPIMSEGQRFHHGSAHLNDCCFEFFPNPVNEVQFTSYYMTDPSCPTKGVFLITTQSCYICAYPNASWVEKVIKHLDSDSP